MNQLIKSISAQKPSRGSGQQRAKKRRGGENVLWRRLTANFDDAVAKLGANPAIGAPLTRLVLFKHLTTTQGMAGRRYADIIGEFEHYHMANGARVTHSANLEPSRGGGDNELERHYRMNSLSEYLGKAKRARTHYERLMKVVGKFRDPVTGRNYAKDLLDDLCLCDMEPPSESRKEIAVVLSMVAKEFGINERRQKR